MAYVFSKAVVRSEDTPTLSMQSLLQDYLSVAWNGEGTAPSGADLIAQFNGQITYFDRLHYQIETLTWPFSDLSFLIVRTGYKIATHHHLQKLQSFAMDQLLALCQETYFCFSN